MLIVAIIIFKRIVRLCEKIFQYCLQNFSHELVCRPVVKVLKDTIPCNLSFLNLVILNMYKTFFEKETQLIQFVKQTRISNLPIEEKGETFFLEYVYGVYIFHVIYGIYGFIKGAHIFFLNTALKVSASVFTRYVWMFISARAFKLIKWHGRCRRSISIRVIKKCDEKKNFFFRLFYYVFPCLFRYTIMLSFCKVFPISFLFHI